jgi:hypothetical protein
MAVFGKIKHPFRVHHFETIPGPIWKPDVHHLR